MIVVKCMGKKTDIIKISADDVSTIFQIKERLSEQLCVNVNDVCLKLKGKKVDDDQIVHDGMKLIGVISNNSIEYESVHGQVPVKCIGYKKDCVFYGRIDADGYCSVCYKSRLKDDIDREAQPKKQKIFNDVSVNSKKPVQIDNTRCWECKKRIGLLGFQCKCGYKYCGLHRYPEEHQCDFDYKKDQHKQLSDQLHSYAIEKTKLNKL